MTGVVALAATGLALVLLALGTARRPPGDVPSLAGYLARWRNLHGGYDPYTGSRVVRGWLVLVHALGRPVARLGVRPDVVTLASVWFAAAVWVAAAAGGRWALVAALLLVASGVLDSLDGCVAVLQSRATRWGYVLDSAADRVTDAVYLAALVAVGAPGELAVAVGFGSFFLEYVRARAGNAGGDDVGRITVAERPNRVIFPAVALVAAGAVPAQAEAAATVGTSVLGALTAVGIVQLVVAVRRQLVVADGA